METGPTRKDLELRIKELERRLSTSKRKEEALHRMAVIVRDSNDAITVQSFDGTITAWNRGAENMYGYEEEEALEMNILEVIPEQEREEALGYRRRIQEGQVIDSFETQRITKDGRLLDVWLTVTALTDETGTPISIATTERDISERKRNEERLKRNSERIKTFAYSIIHDLKNPSFGVYGLAKRLQQQCGHLLDEKGKAYCDQILKGTEQIAVLAEKVNMYITTQETPIRVENIRLKEILDTLKDEFSTQIRLRQIEWLYPDSLPRIRGDRLSLFRALRNLLDNALKYGGDNLSEIRIDYEASDEFHVLSISDNGIGIKSKDCETLFLPFHREFTSAKVEGTGLGLAIVKEVAEQHGGKVWANPGPGKGVTFSLAISKAL